MRNLISLFLVFSIFLLSGNMFAQERKGADLIIQKKNGQQVRGELIAVKENSPVLLERESGADVSFDIQDIRVITIVKKSQLLAGAGFGTLIGAGIGVVVGSIGDEPGLFHGIQTAAGGALGALAGLLIGAIVGSSTGKDETIQFEGMPDSTIKANLAELRKNARIKNAQ